MKYLEIMCWQNLKNNCKELIETRYITGRNKFDRKLLIELIADEYPEISRCRITNAVDIYLKTMNTPITSYNFVHFVQGYLR